MDMAGFVARFLAYGVACWLLFGPGAARGADRFAGMDPYIREAMQKWEIPGLAIAVVKDGELVLVRGYGICELGKDRKVTKDTVFPIASCTKSFTAACVAMLVEEGKLGWDDPVAKHLPGFELSDPYLTKHVTLRDMLCHRIGLPWAELLSGDSREVLRRIKYIEPIADFRTRFTYSNAMYVVAGEVVAHASGQPWEQFVAERIFKPLHMVSTTVSVTDVEADRLALRHWNSDEGIVARPLARDPVRADGGIHSTVVDLAQWVKLQLAEGQSEGRRLLSEKTVREMHALQFSSPVTAQPRNIYTARFYGTGLGWQVLDYRGRKVIRHGGGWGAWVAMIPEEKLGVIILSNLDLNGLVGMLMYDVFDTYLVGPELAWDRCKWKIWLQIEGPGYAYRPRDEAKAQLEKIRIKNTKPSLPLEQYAGRYESKLYGPFVVRHDGGRLFVTFGEFTTELSHWQHEAFYVRAPTRLTFDWLLTFGHSRDGKVDGVILKHVGWDKDEKDHLFVRLSDVLRDSNSRCPRNPRNPAP